jgi:hypothetical protein
MGTFLVMTAILWVGIWLTVGILRLILEFIRAFHWGRNLPDDELRARIWYWPSVWGDDLSNADIATALTILFWIVVLLFS